MQIAMNKTKIIIKREFNNRVKKKAFVIMSILGPLLFSAMFIVPAYIQNSVKEVWNVVVVDKTGLTESHLKGNFEFQNSSAVQFNLDHLKEDYAEVKTLFFDSARHSVIYLNEGIINPIKKKDQQPKILIPTNFKDAPPPVVESTIKDQMREFVQLIRLNSFTKTESGKPTSDLLEVDVDVVPEDLESLNEKNKSKIEFALSLIGSILIYFFILLFGSTVMKGVSEEKNSRIVEVLISSVRPFQLMIGKIVGIGLSAIAQFGIWIVLSIGVITGFSSYLSEKLLSKQLDQVSTQLGESGQSVNMPSQEVIQQASELGTDNFLGLLNMVDWPIVCGAFVLFFIGGYLLYAALFSAVGSTLDVDTDAQQFVFPLTIPLVLSVFIASSVLENPDSTIAQWASFIPFSSPIVMMARIPFGVPLWQVGVSMLILALTIFFIIKGAAKIYRTGILMYGQKITYKTLWKWLRH
jgi:ABC-2 type transport system permease protein